MTNKNDFSTTFLKVGMKFKNAEKLVNYLIDKNITMKGTVLLAMLGSKQMYEIIIKKCDTNAKIIIADSDLVTDYFENYKNIICINIDENDADDFYNKLKNMPNFDFVVQNPPYKGSLHLDFFKKGYEMLSNKGQMIIIEPAMWLINVRKYGKRGEEMRVNSSAIKKYDEIKKMLDGQVKKVIIENYNKEFNVGLYTPFSISYIDKAYNSDIIDCKICGEQKTLTSLYDCNLNGKYDLIWSIFNKINCDKLSNHIIHEKINDNNIYYAKILDILGRSFCGDPRWSDVWFTNNLYAQPCYWCIFDVRMTEPISNEPHKCLKNGCHYDKPIYTDKIATNIYGTYNELSNLKYNIYNTKLFPFLNICINIDQNNNSLDYVPWLVDKKYTDQEIYDMFKFTDEEIKLIETTIKKYERNSPWFKRYMCGPSEVTDEEVQKFIEDLNNVKG